MYIATRALYNLKPPTVFVPLCIKDDVEELLQVHRRMSQIELNVDLVALDLGMNSSSPFFFLVCILFVCFLCPTLFQGRHTKYVMTLLRDHFKPIMPYPVRYCSFI
jgi:hypothetical protein